MPNSVLVLHEIVHTIHVLGVAFGTAKKSMGSFGSRRRFPTCSPSVVYTSVVASSTKYFFPPFQYPTFQRSIMQKNKKNQQKNKPKKKRVRSTRRALQHTREDGIALQLGAARTAESVPHAVDLGWTSTRCRSPLLPCIHSTVLDCNAARDVSGFCPLAN